MKKKISNRDEDMPVGKLTRVENFLPPPEELFPKSEKKKITLEIDDDTVSFFKSKAKQTGTKYQKMMREVLKGYAKKYN
jgi:uncharacterized protein (DUF4415 family)